MKRFLETQPDFPKDRRTGLVRFEEVARLMRRVHYAGHVEAPDWGVSLGKDISADFPLREFILCNDCKKPLITAL